MGLDGILLIDKAQGWTSHDVCAFIRSRFRIKKVGHAGTLDPSATGLLVILLGNATRLSGKLSADDKVYQGSIRLGLETDSYDLDGKVLREIDWQPITPEQVRETAKQFLGEIEQEPPMVSAVRQNGKRLYELARKGQTVEREKRSVTVHRFDIVKIDLPHIYFYAHVSKGTYLRAIAHDWGLALQCCGVLEQLRRTQCGRFSVDQAVTIEALRILPREQLGQFVQGLKDIAE